MKNRVSWLFKMAVMPIKIAFQRTSSIDLNKKVIYATITSLFLGILFRNFDHIKPNPDAFVIIGDMFVSLVQMIMVPFIFFSITSSILSIGDMGKVGRYIKISITFFAISALILVLLSTLISFISQKYFYHLDAYHNNSFNSPLDIGSVAINTTNIIKSIIPSNIFRAANEGNMIQIVFFSIMFGIGCCIVRSKISDDICIIISSLNDIMINLFKIIMKFSPIGIFCLIINIIGYEDSFVILSLIRMFCSIFSLVISTFVIYSLILYLHGLNPMRFFQKMFNVQLLAMATQSSVVALPLNIKNANKRLGVSEQLSKITITTGSTISMAGSAAVIIMYVIFVSQMNFSYMPMSSVLYLVIIGVVASFAIPPIPTGAVVICAGVLSIMGYPLESIGMILAIDKIIAPLRVLINVTNAAFIAVISDKRIGILDMEVYNSK
jgi:Na+/H+-dicarboxylate symporter